MIKLVLIGTSILLYKDSMNIDQLGMAEWNSIFSNIWQENIGDINIGGIAGLPDPITSLPDINFPTSESFQNSVRKRINLLVKAGFTNNDTYVTLDLADQIKFSGENLSNFYIVCFGARAFYEQNSFDPLSRGHFQTQYYTLPESISKAPEAFKHCLRIKK